MDLVHRRMWRSGRVRGHWDIINWVPIQIGSMVVVRVRVRGYSRLWRVIMITLGGMRELEVIAHVGSVYRPAQGYNPEPDRCPAVELGGQSFVPVELAVGRGNTK